MAKAAVAPSSPGREVDEGEVNHVNKLGSAEQAAAALCDLAFGDDAMQDAIIDAGGVPPLLSLIRGSTPEGQEHAARAIWFLCSNLTTRSI